MENNRTLSAATFISHCGVNEQNSGRAISIRLRLKKKKKEALMSGF